jgi:hypothetical protein
MGDVTAKLVFEVIGEHDRLPLDGTEPLAPLAGIV